ncbi:NnrS family protein [Stutzerimonas kirkiae]|uniref:NnrS family protein n=1 Tax=Stutzerimonas kirkiae TaxID=2211392 RepID=UPI0010383A16|nr:NnrS family protein [Stutzerimonas kirkiae]TBV12063.1 short-chain dehydrogenase [Stutzerimonas kirkiae]TBV14928.1 short-chain dehydrogenase [Stutzerimonas kirkiae]
MQVIDRRKALAIAPIWRLAFRPFFLAGSLYALLAIPLWVIAWTGIWPGWQPAGGWLAWHRHEMLFGFVMAIVAGFLLTAVQAWTGRPSLSGRSLMLLAALWLAARLGWLLGLPAVLLAPLEMAFPLLLAGALARLLWAVRQKRNYPVVVVLGLLAGADALSLYGLARFDEGMQRQAALAGIWLVAALMGMIGGRVIPFFTQRGLGRAEAVRPWAWLDLGLLAATVLVALLHGLGVAVTLSPPLGILFLGIALGHAVRLWRWYARGLWRVPLLWSLHLALAWLALACLGMAFWHFGVLHNASLALHALTVGAMAGLILAMIARVSLGHTGRPLALPAGMAWGFALLNLGALVRVFLYGFWPHGSLWLAALLWALAFAIFVWRYAPMLCRARVDGHPG